MATVPDWPSGRAPSASRAPANAAPHSLQNFAFGGYVAPQEGQALVNAAPHSLQNFAPPGFSLPQLEQVIRFL
jgi:hypothetical protein